MTRKNARKQKKTGFNMRFDAFIILMYEPASFFRTAKEEIERFKRGECSKEDALIQILSFISEEYIPKNMNNAEKVKAMGIDVDLWIQKIEDIMDRIAKKKLTEPDGAFEFTNFACR